MLANPFHSSVDKLNAIADTAKVLIELAAEADEGVSKAKAYNEPLFPPNQHTYMDDSPQGGQQHKEYGSGDSNPSSPVMREGGVDAAPNSRQMYQDRQSPGLHSSQPTWGQSCQYYSKQAVGTCGAGIAALGSILGPIRFAETCCSQFSPEVNFAIKYGAAGLGWITQFVTFLYAGTFQYGGYHDPATGDYLQARPEHYPIPENNGIENPSAKKYIYCHKGYWFDQDNHTLDRLKEVSFDKLNVQAQNEKGDSLPIFSKKLDSGTIWCYTDRDTKRKVRFLISHYQGQYYVFCCKKDSNFDKQPIPIKSKGAFNQKGKEIENPESEAWYCICAKTIGGSAAASASAALAFLSVEEIMEDFNLSESMTYFIQGVVLVAGLAAQFVLRYVSLDNFIKITIQRFKNQIQDARSKPAALGFLLLGMAIMIASVSNILGNSDSAGALFIRLTNLTGLTDYDLSDLTRSEAGLYYGLGLLVNLVSLLLFAGTNHNNISNFIFGHPDGRYHQNENGYSWNDLGYKLKRNFLPALISIAINFFGILNSPFLTYLAMSPPTLEDPIPSLFNQAFGSYAVYAWVVFVVALFASTITNTGFFLKYAKNACESLLGRFWDGCRVPTLPSMQE